MVTDNNGRGRAVEAVTSAVAQHVRALRQSRGWSLDELSARSGVSKGMVVQIEGARTNPSVGTLVRLADAFGVTVTRLLEPAADRTVRITSADEAPLLWQGGYGGYGRLLGGRSEPDIVELWEWLLQPHDKYESTEHPPGTRELLHVLSGELAVQVDNVSYHARAGETIDFQGDKPHGYVNPFDAPARFVMVVVVTPPTPTSRRSR